MHRDTTQSLQMIDAEVFLGEPPTTWTCVGAATELPPAPEQDWHPGFRGTREQWDSVRVPWPDEGTLVELERERRLRSRFVRGVRASYASVVARVKRSTPDVRVAWPGERRTRDPRVGAQAPRALVRPT